ncbi:MAG: Hpt domain-containing protein [Candidatus Riflebacteria bacterium]|nr:Hpt domain-containing protein [Candidatus Riflebacteria bacterium]
METEMRYVLKVFISENLDLLESIEQTFNSLGKLCPDSSESSKCLNNLFWLFHSLKGGAALFNLNNVKLVTQKSEDFIDHFRQNKIKVESEHISVMKNVCEFIRKSLTHVSIEFNDLLFDFEANKLAEVVAAQMASLKSAKKDEVQEVFIKSNGKTPTNLFSQPDNPLLTEKISHESFSLSPEVRMKFLSEAERMLDDIVSFVEVFHNSDKPNEDYVALFKTIHSFTGLANFLDYPELYAFSKNLSIICDAVINNNVSEEITKVSAVLVSSVVEIKRKMREPGFLKGGNISFDDSIKYFIDSLAATIRKENPSGGMKRSLEKVAARDSRKEHHYSTLYEMDISLTQEMMTEFVKSSMELLTQIEESLSVVDHNPVALDKIENAMKAFHSFSGLASFFGYKTFSDVSRLAEIVLFHVIKNPSKSQFAVLQLIKSILADLRAKLRNSADADSSVTHESTFKNLISIENYLDCFMKESEKARLLHPRNTLSDLFPQINSDTFKTFTVQRSDALRELLKMLRTSPGNTHLLENVAMELQALKKNISSLVESSIHPLPWKHPLQALRILCQSAEIFAGRIFNQNLTYLEDSVLDTIAYSLQEIEKLISDFYSSRLTSEINYKLFSKLSVNCSIFREKDLPSFDMLVKKMERKEFQNIENINLCIDYLEDLENTSNALNRSKLAESFFGLRNLLSEFLKEIDRPFSQVFIEFKEKYQKMLTTN